MKRLKDFKEMQWIEDDVIARGFCSLRVKHVIPNRYSHYCKILNPIYHDINIKDESLFYSDCNPDSFEPTFGEKLLYKELAKKYKLPFTKDFSSSTITQALGRYPRYMLLGGEGEIEEHTFHEVLSVLKSFTPQEQCYFQYSLLKIINEIPDCDKLEKGLLYEGDLNDVLSTYHTGDHIGIGSPTYWWAHDRSWCIHTDYDSDFSILGGSKELVDILLSKSELECIQVDLDTRVGSGY